MKVETAFTTRFSSLLSCFVRRHNLLLSVSMARQAVLFIHVLMNLVCFNAVLFTIDGATSARFLAFFSSLCLLFRSSFQYGFVVFSRTFWDTFLCCMKNKIVELFYNNIHISVVHLNAVS